MLMWALWAGTVAILALGLVYLSRRYDITLDRPDPVIDGLIAKAGVQENGQRRRYVGLDETLRQQADQRRQAVEHLRSRARKVETGAFLLHRAK